VITVTRIEPLKGTGTLLAAAELVQAVAPDVRFLLVGPWEQVGRRERRLMALCQRSRAVRWIGPRQDVQSLLALADLFVLPTEFREGLPRVLLEAALAGLPIVTTDMPGCRAVVRHGKNGLLVPPRTPGALAAAILELLNAPERAQAMGRQGAALVRDRLSLDSIAAQYASLYRTLAMPAVMSAVTPARIQPSAQGRAGLSRRCTGQRTRGALRSGRRVQGRNGHGVGSAYSGAFTYAEPLSPSAKRSSGRPAPKPGTHAPAEPDQPMPEPEAR
jgi:Glycosyl transferases group 1